MRPALRQPQNPNAVVVPPQTPGRKRPSFEDGKITASEVQNVVKVGLLQGDFDWVWIFYKNRHNIFGSEHPETYFQFNLANFWFYNKAFDKALDTLSSLNFEELHYKISAKLLEIKILWNWNRIFCLQN
ncbi:MAG: hypothetical protein IPL65_10485 [Lewinellaceae bacterium]|nr:hypothetical protein [Lewinellaceae bacterium]